MGIYGKIFHTGCIMKIQFSPAVKEKLLVKHNVVEKEVFECFVNREGNYLKDTREQHQTTPPTLWFIAETNRGRLLKICFIPPHNGFPAQLKSAFEPNEVERRIYASKGAL